MVEGLEDVEKIEIEEKLSLVLHIRKQRQIHFSLKPSRVISDFTSSNQ